MRSPGKQFLETKEWKKAGYSLKMHRRAQELSFHLNKKTGSGGRKPEWLSKDLQVRLREKKEKYKQRKQWCVDWKEYSDDV